MTVYSTATLQNKYTRQQAKEAFSQGYITADVLENIYTQHPVDLYSPNLFVKIGLGVLTLFISLCSVGLMALLFDVNHLFEALLVIMGILSYAALEIMAGPKKHYNSGVDNILMTCCVLFICSGISFGYSINSPQVISFIVFAICAWLSIRFVDRVAAFVATLSFLSFVLNAYVDLSDATIATFPYLLILVSGCIYYFSNRFARRSSNEIYKPLINVVAGTCLLAFYFSGNYYVVQQLTESSYLLLKDSALNFPYFFWLWTLVLPFVILFKGIRDKDVFLLRAGAVLIAIAVITFRYYYSIVPAEVAMTVAGLLLLVISYLVMQYLRTPKHGFVFDDKTVEQSDIADLQGFVIGQTVGPHHQPDPDTKFGGGSFGGAGAGSEY